MLEKWYTRLMNVCVVCGATEETMWPQQDYICPKCRTAGFLEPVSPEKVTETHATTLPDGTYLYLEG